MMKHVESLMKLMKSTTSNMTWDQTGSLIYKGKTLQDTNFTKPFQLTFNVNKKLGKIQTEFLHALHKTVVHSSIIKNKYL